MSFNAIIHFVQGVLTIPLFRFLFGIVVHHRGRLSAPLISIIGVIVACFAVGVLIIIPLQMLKEIPLKELSSIFGIQFGAGLISYALTREIFYRFYRRRTPKKQ